MTKKVFKKMANRKKLARRRQRSLNVEEEWFVVGKASKDCVYRYWLNGGWIQPTPEWQGGPKPEDDVPTLLTKKAATEVAESDSGMIYAWNSVRKKFGVGDGDSDLPSSPDG